RTHAREPLAERLLVVCFLRPRPPPPAVFPYTTLFRSADVLLAERARSEAGARPCADQRASAEVGEVERRRPVAAAPRGPDRREQDRKSTRLNSSHVKISYAVFCLKKKNTKHPPRGPPT